MSAVNRGIGAASEGPCACPTPGASSAILLGLSGFLGVLAAPEARLQGSPQNVRGKPAAEAEAQQGDLALVAESCVAQSWGSTMASQNP